MSKRGHRVVCPLTNPRGLQSERCGCEGVLIAPVPQRGRPLCPTVPHRSASGGRGPAPLTPACRGTLGLSYRKVRPAKTRFKPIRRLDPTTPPAQTHPVPWPAMPAPAWSVDDYARPVDDATPLPELTDWLYRTVCRQTLDRPGFCVLTLPATEASARMRDRMVALTRALSGRHLRETGEELIYQSATRFDQQGTTKLHRDGGPENCFLMLGYEPSTVESEVAVADSSACARRPGALGAGTARPAQPDVSRRGRAAPAVHDPPGVVPSGRAQIVCVNNSLRSTAERPWSWKGMLHTAQILRPDPLQSRVINSTLIVSVPVGTAPFLTDQEIEEFRTTEAVHRRRY